jgi:hypothetical protein
MTIRILFLVLLSIFSFQNAYSRPLRKLPSEKRVLTALRINEPIKIDGLLNESSWEKAMPADDFYQYEPFNGSFPSEKSVVRVLYDDNAIYVGATLYDLEANKIYRELGKRDNSDNLKSDAFSFLISPYNDGINYLEFIVSASGVQTDIRRTGNSSDRSWDAVWESSVVIDNDGWHVELKIPFSALRFSSKIDDNWGVNFRRLIKRYNEWNSWNPIDNSISGIVNQSGELAGISDIKSPIRLSFSPYISAYLDKFPEKNSLDFRVNGGMDLQFGISESFTLDMTLIPDFGQVKSDDKVHNISPFEVHYSEQRPFFNEGMDLFRKGDIFYSRRIGTRPKGYYIGKEVLNENEVVGENPTETSMINASKITGRTSNGLGVGFLNAMTASTYATIVDTVTGNKRQYLTQGFTNYNMLVLDQTLKHNSYISLANTNLVVDQQKYLSNVTATDFVIRNKSNGYAVSGVGALSFIDNQELNHGYKYYLRVDKTSGKILFNVWNNTENKTYNPNDMGYLQKANEFSNGGSVSYRIFKPFWRLLNWNSSIGASYRMLHEPRLYQSSDIWASVRTTFAKSYHSVGLDFWMNPKDLNDYNEPRVEGRMVIRPKRISGGFWTSSDYRRTIALDTRAGYWKANSLDQENYYVSISPRFRFSDNMFLVYQIRQDFDKNNIGYVARVTVNENQIIYMGLRDVSTLTNTLDGLYSFNAKAFVNIRIRHYWRWLDYSSYHTLNTNGTLSDAIENSGYNRNINVNLFNIDLTYQWNFAPGSVISVVWKNAIDTSDQNVRGDFFNNFGGILESNQINSISFRMLYYIDYNTLVNSRRRS